MNTGWEELADVGHRFGNYGIDEQYGLRKADVEWLIEALREAWGESDRLERMLKDAHDALDECYVEAMGRI